MWTDRHNQDTEEFAVDVCGETLRITKMSDIYFLGGGTGEGKFSVPIDMIFPHSTDNIVIGFGSTIEAGRHRLHV